MLRVTAVTLEKEEGMAVSSDLIAGYTAMT